MCEGHGHTHDHGERRVVSIEEKVLSKNDAIADETRHELAHRGAFMVNILSAPGSGKTTLLEKAIPLLMRDLPVAVIEGDVQTRYDAERLRRCGVAAVQINTGGGCHLDADGVARVLAREPFLSAKVVVIENVGNLVCPAAFDVGEDEKLVVLSVTEGDDKPEKYPAAFAHASAAVISKIDLLPHVSFDVDRCKEGIWQVNPDLPVMLLSSTTGEGLDAFVSWLRGRYEHKALQSHHH